MSIIESIRSYLCTCPFLKDGKMNVDYLGAEPTEYTVDGVPVGEVVRTYVDGSSMRQFEFIFASREFYGASVMLQLENAGFYQQFSEWIQEQNTTRNFPVLENGKESVQIEVVTGGYLFSDSADTARYQIQCRLTYFQPAQTLKGD